MPTHSVRRAGERRHDRDSRLVQLSRADCAGDLAAVRAAHDRGARLVSVCSGAFVLAAAGLLDGRRATTHWRHAETLARRYPRVHVEPTVLYVKEDSVYTPRAAPPASTWACTSCGRTTDPTSPTRWPAAWSCRPIATAGRPQFVPTAVPPADGSLAPIMEWASGRIDQPLDAAALARKGRMSMRTLARRFEAQAGTTPHQWLTHQRVLAAQRLLETSAASIERVAELSGFATPETLRHPLPATGRHVAGGVPATLHPHGVAAVLPHHVVDRHDGDRAEAVARTGASMVARSPTITTARRSSSR